MLERDRRTGASDSKRDSAPRSGRVDFLLLALLFLLALSARAEFPVTETRPLAPTLGVSRDAHVVGTDTGFLAIWTTDTTYGERGLMQSARYSPDGVLERRATAWELPASFRPFDAASNGEEVLVAGVCGDAWAPPCLARFSAAGDFLGLTQLPLRRVSSVRVASDGDGFLLLLGMSAPREVLAIPIAAGGAVGTTLLLHSWGGDPESLSVTSAAGAYFATFGFGTERYLARVSEGGIEKSVRLDLPVGPASTIRAEGSRDRVLVIAAGFSRLYSIFDPELGVRVAWSPFEIAQKPVHVTATSIGWLVAGASGSARVVRPVLADGTLGPVQTLIGAGDFAGRDDRVATVWSAGSEARIAILSDEGSTLLESTLSLGPAPQVHPSAAHGNGVTLAAWTERSANGTFVVKARPFDQSGTPLAPALSMPFRGSSQIRPAVAFNGETFLIVWSEGNGGAGGISGARVTDAGALLDPEGIALFGAGSYREGDRTADVAWSGVEWIVVSSDVRGSIAAVRVCPAGLVRGTPLEISPLPRPQRRGDAKPVLDCNGSECLVAWEGPPLDECRITCVPPPSLWAIRISPTLSLLDGIPMLITRGVDEYVSRHDVSWNAISEEWLVTWSNQGEHRITRGGTFLPRDQAGYVLPGERTVVAEREGWRMAWSTGASRDLFHGWSATGAIPALESHFALTRTPEHESDPRLVAAPRPIVFFMRESQIDAGSPRVFGRFLDESTEPEAATITLTAERRGGFVRLSWQSSDNVIVFGVQELIGANWSGAAYTKESTTSVLLTNVRGRTFRLSGFTRSGSPVLSNEVDLPLLRKRQTHR